MSRQGVFKVSRQAQGLPPSPTFAGEECTFAHGEAELQKKDIKATVSVADFWDDPWGY